MVQREKHPEDARCRPGCRKAVARGAAAGFALARAGSWGSALPGGLAGRAGPSPGQHGWPRGLGRAERQGGLVGAVGSTRQPRSCPASSLAAAPLPGGAQPSFSPVLLDREMVKRKIPSFRELQSFDEGTSAPRAGRSLSVFAHYLVLLPSVLNVFECSWQRGKWEFLNMSLAASPSVLDSVAYELEHLNCQSVQLSHHGSVRL